MKEEVRISRVMCVKLSGSRTVLAMPITRPYGNLFSAYDTLVEI